MGTVASSRARGGGLSTGQCDRGHTFLHRRSIEAETDLGDTAESVAGTVADTWPATCLIPSMREANCLFSQRLP